MKLGSAGAAFDFARDDVIGVLMSLEPAVAAVVGNLALDQVLATREVLAIGLVLAASAGALSRPGVEPPVEP